MGSGEVLRSNQLRGLSGHHFWKRKKQARNFSWWGMQVHISSWFALCRFWGWFFQRAVFRLADWQLIIYQHRYVSETDHPARRVYFHMVLSALHLPVRLRLSDSLARVTTRSSVSWRLNTASAGSSVCRGWRFNLSLLSLTPKSQNTFLHASINSENLHYMFICIYINLHDYTLMLLSIQQLQKKPGQLIFLIDMEVNLM